MTRGQETLTSEAGKVVSSGPSVFVGVVGGREVRSELATEVLIVYKGVSRDSSSDGWPKDPLYVSKQ